MLLLRFGGWLWLAEADAPMVAVLASVAVWARTAPLLALAWWPPLRQEGSGARHAAQQRALVWELLPSCLLLVGLALGFGLWILLGSMASIGVALLLVRLLGWQIGDSMGATLEWSATACLWILLGSMASIGVALLLGRLLGGQSGDSLGATLEWSATACLWLYGLVLVAPAVQVV
ncbi:MAG: adenosylcobinamide-GDP ribazoletransferase [Synechococcus sp. SB0664_bin_36]|nr:adenosylcobinamide-GDP ribazoletransferase [Synechococcus sp. SB0664_bin_36]